MVAPEITEAVRDLVGAFDQRGARYALVGGLAVGLRSRPRATKDADFIVQVSAIQLPGLLETIKALGFDIDVIETIRRWNADRFVAFYRGSVRIDWMQPVLPVYATVMNAAEPRPWMDATVQVARADGLILTKLLAFRSQDQVDIETLLIANRDEIDLEMIRREWAPFATGEADRTAWLERAIAKYVPGR